MRFWDTSAIVPLCVDEDASARVRELATEDGAIVVWWATRLECASAVARRRRENMLDDTGELQSRKLLGLLARAWSEILPHEQLRVGAERLLAAHPLRAADALQLAAALVWCSGKPARHGFVCLDERLRSAAAREGFDVMPGTPG